MNTTFGFTVLRALSVVGVSAAMLCGCAIVEETASQAFSSKAQAIAVFGGRVLHGQASFSGDREASIQLQSADQPDILCAGVLRFTATTSGSVSFSCNDGKAGTVPFASFSPLSGTGRGLVGDTEFAWTYGMPPARAAGYLALPADRLKPPPPATGG